MTTDVWISRGIAIAVAIAALVVTIGFALKPSADLKELTLLLAGGLLGILNPHRVTPEIPETPKVVSALTAVDI